MRRSAGTGGRSMLRAVGRVVEAGLKDPVAGSPAAAAGGKATKPARLVCVSSSGASSPTSSPSFAAGASGAASAGWGSRSCLGDDEEWESVGGVETVEGGEANGLGLSERFVFGTAPSRTEVEDTVSTLRKVFVPLTFSRLMEDESSCTDQDAAEKEIISVDTMQKVTTVESPGESDADWMEPALHLYRSNTSQSMEREKVFDAFHLLQINPSIQRMVVSLSSDKAVWDAVMRNEVVQELRSSFYEDEGYKKENSDEQPDAATGLLSWILDNTKAKILEIIDTITKLVNELFPSQEKERSKDFFDGAVRSSFMLSVMVFIIVVASRVHRA